MAIANSSMRPGRPSSFKGAWAKLREACGGTDKLAQELNTTPNVVQKWALRGMRPSGPSQVAIALLAQKKGVPNPLLEEVAAEQKSKEDELLERWSFQFEDADKKDES